MDINTLYLNKLIDDTDLVFARTIQRLGHCSDPWTGLAAALVSRAAAEGHVCLDLGDLLGHGLPGMAALRSEAAPISSEQWRHYLTDCGAVGAPGDFRPLILNGNRLYLHRFWTRECRLVQAIQARCAYPDRPDEDHRLETILGQLFPDGDTEQRQAARLAATHRFVVISGGPGTGKTHTVARIIQLLRASGSGQSLRIHLAAPTGKAAARLQESVLAVLGEPNTDSAKIPDARTLHRLLGYMPGAARFRYDALNPLPADVVVVDEASMIDLALMHQLMQALLPHARLVLVGDKDQLASVEAGAVLGDICHGVSSSGAADSPVGGPRLQDHIAVLTRSYRFDPGSGIGALSRAVNAGDAEQTIALLTQSRFGNIGLHAITDRHTLAGELEALIVSSYGGLFGNPEPEALFQVLKRFRIVCAVRQGPYGGEALNGFTEQVLRKQGWIPPAVLLSSAWYPGRPVMVTRNDYYQGLFNGDVGIAMETPAGLRVVFPDTRGGFKWLAPHQLPAHETVYAMTVHKSQGSEFDHVGLVLPDKDGPLLTRELIYTAVTRARRSIRIWADPDILARAVGRRTHRASGLRDALWPESRKLGQNNISR